MYKAVICDLDGTLLSSDHSISEYSKNVIKKIYEMGIKFFIATGRPHPDAKAYKKILNLDSFLISSNGAKIHDEKDNEIFSHNIPADITKEIINFSIDSRIHKSIYADDIWYVEEDLADAKAFHKESGFYYTKSKFENLIGIESTKCFFISFEADLLLELEKKLQEKFSKSLHITFSHPMCLELMGKDVTKGMAIKEVLSKENISLSETISFGDGLNDLDMLTLTKKGLIMGNANPKLKAKLPNHEVIESNDQDGVAKYLEKIFLK